MGKRRETFRGAFSFSRHFEETTYVPKEFWGLLGGNRRGRTFCHEICPVDADHFIFSHPEEEGHFASGGQQRPTSFKAGFLVRFHKNQNMRNRMEIWPVFFFLKVGIHDWNDSRPAWKTFCKVKGIFT